MMGFAKSRKKNVIYGIALLSLNEKVMGAEHGAASITSIRFFRVSFSI
jgi:hypothetical protein